MGRRTRKHILPDNHSHQSTSIPDSRFRAWLLSTVLFLSGASALVYQTLWVKQLSLVVGSDVYAISIAVSSFFAGLALGGYFIGRFADRIQRPLVLFAILEGGIAVLAVGATYTLAASVSLFSWLNQYVGPFAWFLPFLLVGIPAALMGGSLPVLVRTLSTRRGQLAATGGMLYACNTAGAIVGTLLTVFLLIPKYGVVGSSLAAGSINLMAALVAVSMQRNFHVDSATEVPADTKGLVGSRLALLLYGIAGGLALGYEVIWTQVVIQFTSTRTFAFAIVLAVYLTGLTLGSLCFARFAERTKNPWGWFGMLIILAGMLGVLEIYFSGDWLQQVQTDAATIAFQVTKTESVAMTARFVVAAIYIVFFPTLLLGAAFPMVLKLTGDPANAGRDSSVVLAVNTLGGIAGSLLTGFMLIPWLGMEKSLVWLAILAASLGMIAMVKSSGSHFIFKAICVACAAIVALVGYILPTDHLSQGLAKARKGTLIFHESGAGGTVAVIEQHSGSNRFRRLYIQGVSNTGDAMTSIRYMRMQALLPLIIHRGNPRSALVIGLGTGITAGSLKCYEGLERRVCAELMKEVVHASSYFPSNGQVATDAGLDIRVRDGRRELMQDATKYDLITLEPPPPSAAGVVNLYSRDFYKLASARLQPDGLLAQWLPLPTQSELDTKSLIRSFVEVFPYATLWTTELHEMMLVGSHSPIELNLARIIERFKQPGVTTALTEVGINSTDKLLATYVCDRAKLLKYVGDSMPVTDDRPSIEYGPWVLPGEFERYLPNILEIREEPLLIGATEEWMSKMTDHREVLYRFYSTALYAYVGNRDKWQQEWNWVLKKEPNNPYFLWFITGKK